MAENGSSALDPQTQPLTQPEHGTTTVNSNDNVVSQVTGGAEQPVAQSAVTAVDESNKNSGNSDVNKWPGWPGDCVFRLVVPVLKVGSIIGRKGELIKKMCEETRARIRVLDGPNSSTDRIVLISGKEEPEVPLSPAMNAVIRVFKRVSGLSDIEVGNNTPGTAGAAYCSIRLLVAATQAINLIGKQGSLIKSIQESSGSVIRVLSSDVPSYVGSDERIVELQGEALKVLKGLEAVVGHLRKFLVDHSVLPLFEKNYNTPAPLEQPVEPSWSDQQLLHQTTQGGTVTEYSLPLKRDSFRFDRESLLDPQVPSSLSKYGLDPALSGIRTSGLGRAGVPPIVTQVTQIMQIPLAYAEDIIGVAGANIGYIRRSSGAILTVQEHRGLPDEITVEIKGNSSQVQMAQQLIEEFMSGPTESHTRNHGGQLDGVRNHGGQLDGGRNHGGQLDGGLRHSYSQLSSSSNAYTPSLYSGQPYGGYGSSGVGGYNSFRI